MSPVTSHGGLVVLTAWWTGSELLSAYRRSDQSESRGEMTSWTWTHTQTPPTPPPAWCSPAGRRWPAAPGKAASLGCSRRYGCYGNDSSQLEESRQWRVTLGHFFYLLHIQTLTLHYCSIILFTLLFHSLIHHSWIFILVETRWTQHYHLFIHMWNIETAGAV